MTQSLQALLSHAERLRDDTRALLLQAEQAVRHLEQQAVQLEAYRAEYRQRHPAQGGRSSSIEMLRTHEGFMQRLDQALQQQEGQMQAAHKRVAAVRSTLLAQETRVASVRKLLERRGQQAQQVQDRREQRHSDDAALRRRRDDQGASLGWRLGTEPAPLAH